MPNFLSQINALASINLNQTELIKAQVENQPNNAGAGTGVEGQVYFDTTLDVLKVWAGGAWTEVGGGVLTVTSGNANTITIGGTVPNPTVAANTAAVTNGSLNLATGDQIYDFVVGLGYLASFTVAGNTGTSQTISNANTLSILGGTLMSTVAGATDTLTINHGSVSRTDTTSSASPAFGATFTVVDSVSSSAQGHISALNLKTVTLPANTPQTITLTGDVTGTGTTSIATTIAAGAVDFAMINPAAVITSAEGLATNDNDTSWPTSAAVIDYVSAAVVGGLIYKGGYNAATNTPNLDATPIAGIKTGWTYTVTVDGVFFTEQVRVGDVLIAEVDSPTTLADWTTVQNNVDVATLSVIGIGNVNAGTGVGVAYSNGTATVTNTDLGSSQAIFKNVAVSGQSTIVAGTNNDTLTMVGGSGITLTTNAGTDALTITASPAATGYATTITDTATITHGLVTKDVIIQLFDIVTNDTVYADVTRPTTNTATITFAATPTNSIRVLVQKITYSV
jgi:hypothetical protein